MFKHMISCALVAGTLAGCGLEPMEVSTPAPQAPVALDRESSYPARIFNSQTVPLKYDNRGRLGRLALTFKARFLGVVKDESYIWEINGGEKHSGFNSALYPAKDGYLYAIEYDWRGRGGETYYRVGRYQAPRPLKDGTPVNYQLDFPFEKASSAEIAIPWSFLATGVVFRMELPTRAATSQEPNFFMAINPGYEKRFTPEELERIQPFLQQ